jgi:hypothetical protein
MYKGNSPSSPNCTRRRSFMSPAWCSNFFFAMMYPWSCCYGEVIRFGGKTATMTIIWSKEQPSREEEEGGMRRLNSMLPLLGELVNKTINVGEKSRQKQYGWELYSTARHQIPITPLTSILEPTSSHRDRAVGTYYTMLHLNTTKLKSKN